MGSNLEKEKVVRTIRDNIINWHVSMDEKRQILDLSKKDGLNLNEYVKRSVLGQKMVVRGSDYNRNRIIARIKELDSLMEKLDDRSLLSTDELAELHVIKEIRRKWHMEKETA